MINLMSKEHDAESYHCVHFAVDVWNKLTGDDLHDYFASLLEAPDSRVAPQGLADKFAPIHCPVSPCFVVMRRGNRQPHIGIFVEGRVLHMRKTGPVAVTPTSLRIEYTNIRYYACAS